MSKPQRSPIIEGILAASARERMHQAASLSRDVLRNACKEPEHFLPRQIRSFDEVIAALDNLIAEFTVG